LEGGEVKKQEVVETASCDMPQVFPSLATDATGLSEPSRRETSANDSRHKHPFVLSLAPQSRF
jgi:hypothetical protein